MDPLVEVRVVRIGTQKPARVLIRFIDDEFEGREEWVPPARLKVLWNAVNEYRTREQRWTRLYDVGLERGDPRELAAEEVFQLLIEDSVASFLYAPGGAISIKQPLVLANQLNLPTEQLTGHPDSFVEDGAVIAPWEITELVVRTAVTKNAEYILQKAWKAETRARYESIHGHYISASRGERLYISPEVSIEHDNEYGKPCRDILRSWCGIEAVERFDELVELRKEIKRVGDVAQSAINALRAAGHASQASQLERELGTPVEMLRTTDPR